MKRIRIAILGLAIVMALCVVGCTPITQANAADAAAVVGLGSAESYSSGSSKSILAKTIMENKDAIVAAQEKAMVTNLSAIYGGGTVTFTNYLEATDFPASAEDDTFIASSYWKVTYDGVTVTNDGKSYKLDGSIYMRFAIDGLSFDFVLTGDVRISGAIDDTAHIDVLFNASASGYTFTGTVNGYSVESSFITD